MAEETPVTDGLGWPVGYVTGRVVQAVADLTADGDDYPDVLPATGQITFKPQRTVSQAGSAPTVRVLEQAVTVTLDGDGYLSLHGRRGVWLWCGVWAVSAPALGVSPFTVEVTEAHTAESPLDLWAASPYVPQTPGETTYTLKVPSGGGAGQLLACDDSGRLTWTDPPQTGGGQADLSGYPTRQEMTDALAGKADAAQLAAYATTAQLAQAIDQVPRVHVVADAEDAAALPAGSLYVIAPASTGTDPEPVYPRVVHADAGTAPGTDTITIDTSAVPDGSLLLAMVGCEAQTSQPAPVVPDGWELAQSYHIGTLRTYLLACQSFRAAESVAIQWSAANYYTWAIAAVEGAAGYTLGTPSDRTKPAEGNSSTTTLAPAMQAGNTPGLAVAIAWERTGATETGDQVTATSGWQRALWASQGTSAQTIYAATRQVPAGQTSGDCVVTYPNPQATNGVGVQVMCHA